MVRINWDEFKEFRAHRNSQDDNFTTLVYFMKSYYNMSSPVDVYESLANDDLALMMLEKRDINSAEELESFMFKL